MKVRRMSYTAKGADGGRVTQKSAKWYAVFLDFNGGLRRVPLFEDRRASDSMARIIDQLNSLRAANESTLPPELAEAVDTMPAPILERLAEWDIVRSERAATAKTLAEHVADWRASLENGNTGKHAGTTAGHVLKIVNDLQLRRVGDVSASRVEAYLRDLRRDRKAEDGSTLQGISATTRNYYLRDAKSFFKWMVQDRRALANPLAALKPDKTSGVEKRRERRALSSEELRYLLEVTRDGYVVPARDGRPAKIVQPVQRFGMSPAERAMLYRLAVETGLRSSELRSLTRSSFSLSDNPVVRIAAAYAKNRRKDELPLRADTAEELAPHFAGKMPVAVAFPMPKPDKVIDMFRADLNDAKRAWIAAAGSHQERTEREESTFLSYVDEAGRHADFHALRHTFISNLAAGNVHPKTAQRLARHSTITLTMDRYTHLGNDDLARALATLPTFSEPREAARATGTTGESADSLAPSLSPIAPDDAHERPVTTGSENSAEGSENGGNVDKCEEYGEKAGSWARKDSNLRRQSHQIYSLTRLSTSVHARIAVHPDFTSSPEHRQVAEY